MPTYSGPHRVPVGTDPNNIPGDIVAALESVIPALTTAQIDALDWSRKPAGRFVAYDTTKQRLVVSTGAAMVNLIDGRGGTLTEAIIGGLRLFADGTLRVIETVDAANVRIKAGTTILTVTHNGVVRSSRNTADGDFTDTLTTKGYVDALGTWQAWTPTLTASTTNPTASAVAAECRYVQIGKTVTGKAQITITGAGSGTYRLPLPVTPRASAVAARRIGMLQFHYTDPPGLGGQIKAERYFVEQADGQTYCNAIGIASGAISALSHSGPLAALTAGATGLTITYDFTYEAA